MITTHPVSIGSETHALTGHMLLPDGASSEHPVPGAFIVGGPGPLPMDRYTPSGSKQWPALWCEVLAKAGIIGLCYDQRGSGLSSGVYHEADWDALYDDTKGAAEMLAVQPEVTKTAAIAWGEGCGFGMQLAAEGKVAALVLLAPSGRTEEERYARSITALAAKKGLSDRVVQVRINQWRNEVAAAAKRVQNGEQTATVDIGGTPVTTNLVRFLQTVAFDPAKLAPHVKVPVLILHGEADQVILPEESALLAQMLGEKATRLTYPGVAHFVYQHAKAMDDAADWIHKQLGA